MVESDESIQLDPPVVVKAQVPVSSRGKKGGIIFVETRDGIDTAVEKLLNSTVDGHRVESVLVEERIEIDTECYLAISADGSDRVPTLVLSLHGGQDIELVPDEHMESQRINPLVGARPFHVRTVIDRLGTNDTMGERLSKELQPVIQRVWTQFQANDLRLLELNPLGIHTGSLVALDAKVVVDESAIGRQGHDLLQSTLSEIEQSAEADGVDLRVGPGRVGLVTNGAGLGMTTLDLLTERTDESVAGFIDTHGTQFEQDYVKNYLAHLERAGAEAVLFTISAPALDCEIVANGLVEARQEGHSLPVVVRFKGRNAEKAAQICGEAGIATTTSLEKGVAKIERVLEEVEA